MASAKPAIHNKRRNRIRIHHEGVHTLIVCGLALAAIIALSCLFIDNRYVSAAVIVVFSVIYGIMVICCLQLFAFVLLFKWLHKSITWYRKYPVPII